MLLQRDIIVFKKSKTPQRLTRRIGGPFAYLDDIRTLAVGKGVRARVVYAQGEHVILFVLSETATKFWQADQTYLRELTAKGVSAAEPYQAVSKAAGGDLTKAQRDRRDEAWGLVEPLICAVPQIYEKRSRIELVKKRADHARALLIKSGKADDRPEKKGIIEGSAERRIQNLLRRYWYHGMVPDALIPSYENVGNRGQRKKFKGSAKKRKIGGAGHVCRITPEIEKVFEQMTNRYYKGKERATLKFCCDQARAHIATSQMQGKLGLEIMSGDEDWTEKIAVPTYRQFLYWYKRNGRRHSDERQRLGQSGYDMAKKARLSSSRSRLYGIGSRFEIDATKLDIGCVSVIDREAYVGRPTLYLVIDVFSRMIVGMYLGFENESWKTFSMALRNVAEDKVEFCGRFGLEIEHKDWPVRDVMPARLLADRGEGEGYKASDLVVATGIKVENTPGYRGDLKGTIEKRFDIINSFLRQILPGAVAFDHMKRGDDDYRRKAKLNVDEVTKVIIRAILHYNNSHVLKSFRQTRDMLAAKLNPIPREMWNWALSEGRTELKGFTFAELNFALLHRDYATPKETGLSFRGLSYNSPELFDDNYALKVGTANKQMVSWDPSDASAIWRHRGDGSLEKCVLTEADDKAYRGMSFAETLSLRVEQNARKSKAEIMSAISLREAVAISEAEIADATFENPHNLSAASIKRSSESRNSDVYLERIREQLRKASQMKEHGDANPDEVEPGPSNPFNVV